MSVALNEKAVYKLPDEPADRLEAHLDNWRRWMRSDVITDGAPGRAAGCIGGGYSLSFDDMVDTSDIRCARATDAIIRSLEAPQQAAIHHVYLHSVFRFPRVNLAELLVMAKAQIRRGLYERGIY